MNFEKEIFQYKAWNMFTLSQYKTTNQLRFSRLINKGLEPDNVPFWIIPLKNKFRVSFLSFYPKIVIDFLKGVNLFIELVSVPRAITIPKI